jgi:predicted ABC-type ATPase
VLPSTLDRRPILIVLAGSNGAGKSTFYEAHLKALNLHFINADVLARELHIDAYAAAKIAASLREDLVRQRESFVFETVFSDPAGDKLAFMQDAVAVGFTVILIFIGIGGADTSERRVAQRIEEGGHDDPPDKLIARFPRTLENLRKSLLALPHVLVFDNDDLNDPYRLVAIFEAGQPTHLDAPLPPWLIPVIPGATTATLGDTESR